MRYPLFIAKRIIFNAQPSFSRFIIRLAIAATILSVATMVVTLSLVNGFQQAVAEKVYSFWGHVRVQVLEPMRTIIAEDSGFERSDSIEQIIKDQPGVARYHAFAIKSVVLKSKGQFEGVLLKGVDERFDNEAFSRFMQQGSGISFADSSYSRDIQLSATTALRLQVEVGDTLQCFFIRGGQDIRTRPIVISGIYKTGIEEYDKNFAMADIRFLQRLNQWPEGQIGGYELWTTPGASMEVVSASIDEQLPLELRSLTMKEVFPNIFDWLGIQDQTKQIVIAIMLVVAIINLITCLLILVMERTRMVGVLKGLGMPTAKIGSIFWMYAGWIALVGVSMGLGLGVGLCLLQQYTGFIKMDEATYYVSSVPVHMNGIEITAVALGSFIICLLAIMLPLLYVQRISPIKAIRFD